MYEITNLSAHNNGAAHTWTNLEVWNYSEVFYLK